MIAAYRCTWMARASSTPHWRAARSLAEGLSELPGVRIDLDRVQTNLVIFELTSMPAEQFLKACAERGLKGGGGNGRVRFVTRYGITAADVQRALEVCTEVLAG